MSLRNGVESQQMSMFADEMRRNQVIDGFVVNMQNMQDHINSLVQNFEKFI